jgi:hypothetical protein
MIGRPLESEAAPYYFNYINCVEDDDPQRVLAAQLDSCVTTLRSISDQKSLHRYAQEKWSIRQVINHLIDTERVFVVRALWFARGFDTPLPSYDQEIAARGAEADAIAWSDHIEEFHNVRLATISFFRNLPQDAWLRSGIASDKRFTVRALAFIAAGHTAYHFKILQDRYGI